MFESTTSLLKAENKKNNKIKNNNNEIYKISYLNLTLFSEALAETQH